MYELPLDVSMKISPGDQVLGLANVLIALHRTNQIDLVRLLPALQEMATMTFVLQLDGQRVPPQSSTLLLTLLTETLRSRWDDSPPLQAA